MRTPAQQLAAFLAKFDPKVAAVARGSLSNLRARLPGAYELVYDNYNALAIAFSPSETSSKAIFSIAVYPRWVSLFFAQGARLTDRRKLLKGSANKMRHIVLGERRGHKVLGYRGVDFSSLASRDHADRPFAAAQAAHQGRRQEATPATRRNEGAGGTLTP